MEEIKITRHEFIQAEGVERHYGAAYGEFDTRKFNRKKAEVESYAARLSNRYHALRSGEPDLYVAFTELLLSLAKPGDQSAFYYQQVSFDHRTLDC